MHEGPRMPRISLTPRFPLRIAGVVCIALLVAAALSAGCRDAPIDEPEPPDPPAAAAPSVVEGAAGDAEGDAEDEPARAEPQQRAVAGEQAEEPAQAEAAAEQAAEQADEQAAEQAAEQAEERTVAEAGEPAGDSGDAAGDEAADDAEPPIADPLVEYAPVEGVRFQAVINLDVAPNDGGGDADFLALFSDVTVEGAYLASGDHEISITLGESGLLPPMGIVSIGDTLYTNLGFGWEASEGSTGALVEGLGADLLGLNLGGLDLRGLLAGGDIGGLLSALPYAVWEERGAEPLDSGPARVYALQTDSLGALFEILGTGFLGGLFGGGDVIDPESLAESAGLDSLELTLWVDEASGAAVRLDVAMRGLRLEGFGGSGPGLGLGVAALALRLDASPRFGLLTNLRLAVDALDIPGPGGMSGSVVITLEVTDVNSGDVVIEPPI